MKLRRPKRSTAGFTLLEVLVVVIIIGILFAIAAPSWDTFLSRQRVNTVQEQVVQTLRSAQSVARTSRSSQIVVFDNDGSNAKPRFATGSLNNGSPTNWQNLGDIPPGSVELKTNASANTPPNAIVFDSNGTVAQGQAGFRVTATRARTTSPSTNRCVTVKTLLGSLVQGQGAECDL